ncbi:MAG: sulfur carrier protein ThiS [Alcanivoracaceae bacterium]|nr:sulfur carrier protein ThiS [Alcanivoracaceae bacterium]
MKLTVNGETMEFDGTTVADLVRQQGLAGRRLAVEINREIVPKGVHDSHALKDGDVIEIVHAIGGG